MDNFLAGNMIWNAVLIAGLGFMIRLWMKDTKDKISTYCAQNREDHKEIYGKLELHGERITALEMQTER